MENLHLAYAEVLDAIPYRNLVVMQMDKMHAVCGELEKEVGDGEMLRFDSLE